MLVLPQLVQSKMSERYINTVAFGALVLLSYGRKSPICHKLQGHQVSMCCSTMKKTFGHRRDITEE